MSKDDEFIAQLGKIRDTTRNLIESVMLDVWPGNAAVIDFGVDSQKHYEALYYPIREGEIMPEALDAALGHGQKLTDMVREAPSNPHKEVQFSTSWDGIFGREVPPGALSEEEKLEWVLQGLTSDLDEDVPPTPEETKALFAEWREDAALRTQTEQEVAAEEMAYRAEDHRDANRRYCQDEAFYTEIMREEIAAEDEDGKIPDEVRADIDRRVSEYKARQAREEEPERPQNDMDEIRERQRERTPDKDRGPER